MCDLWRSKCIRFENIYKLFKQYKCSIKIASTTCSKQVDTNAMSSSIKTFSNGLKL